MPFKTMKSANSAVSSVNPNASLGNGRTLFRLAVILPFFLGALLHLSVIFRVFGALPVVYAHLRYGRLAGILCSITNMALVWGVSGRIEAAWFFVLAIVLGATLAECLKLKLKLEWTVLFSMLMMFVGSFLLLLSYSHKVQKGPFEIIKSYISVEVDEFAKNAEKYKATSNVSSQDLDKILIDPEMTKQNILEALFSVVAISILLLVVANLFLILRLNLNGIRDKLALKADFFKKWKAPDHMVWVTLSAGFCLVVEIPILSDVALNVFRVLMAIYAIQGLAIINALFDVWGVKGFFRPLGYMLAVTFLLPLVISLGFFDLWFCFREKIAS